MNSIVPDTINPICSCGWECVGTTASGARVTRESIIFSPEAIFAVTPGASVLDGISSGSGTRAWDTSSRDYGGGSGKTYPP